jgi:hypothetical protein
MLKRKTAFRAKKIAPEQYSYRVIWSAEDNEFVGLCTEFPSLSCWRRPKWKR